MNWTENKTLLNFSEQTPCKEIFQAVCDEIGRHYEHSGFKYSRSRPKLTFKDNEIKLEICFYSSASNMQGEYVNLEIIPHFYSVELSKLGKAKGYLFGLASIFSSKYSDDPKKIKIIQIFGDVIEREDPQGTESILRYNHNCDVYGIDESKFNKIIEFIDNRIINWVSRIKTEEGINELIENPTQMSIWALNLNQKGGNSDFKEYIKIKFPRINMNQWSDQ